jgi:hypothetical protein
MNYPNIDILDFSGQNCKNGKSQKSQLRPWRYPYLRNQNPYARPLPDSLCDAGRVPSLDRKRHLAERVI